MLCHITEHRHSSVCTEIQNIICHKMDRKSRDKEFHLRQNIPLDFFRPWLYSLRPSGFVHLNWSPCINFLPTKYVPSLSVVVFFHLRWSLTSSLKHDWIFDRHTNCFFLFLLLSSPLHCWLQFSTYGKFCLSKCMFLCACNVTSFVNVLYLHELPVPLMAMIVVWTDKLIFAYLLGEKLLSIAHFPVVFVHTNIAVLHGLPNKHWQGNRWKYRFTLLKCLLHSISICI